MIQRALKLRPRINLFCAECSDNDRNALDSSDVLSKDDWTVLQAVNDLLHPFWKVTLRLQGQATDGSYGAIWEVLPSMQYLINALERASEIHTYRKAKHLHICINNALAKLREYSQLLDDSPVYAASLVVNPAIKESYFDRNGRGDAEKKKEDIRAFWAAEYKDKVITGAESDTAAEATPENEVDDTDDLENFIYHQGATSDIQDEYSRYCNESILKKAPPHLLQYWNAQVINIPSLAQMALDFLSIPAMSAECERVFSGSKILISDRRNRLRDDIIEANECLRYWHQKNYFEYGN